MIRAERLSFAGLGAGDVDPEVRWFDRCDFAGADLRHATFDGCHFRLCSFVKANLVAASFRGATFAGCHFTDANLSFADLTATTFTYVNTGTDQGRTVLEGVRVEGAKLSGVTTERVVGLPLAFGMPRP
ncbi:pentapeptide repeat-containing protein [Aeromicrobium fastidiosum]|uniref:pentapeptide repeat-containing protein n=1 Tax=Aeromicrobium fastidiosum TaxID=52699 RepID=UPI002023596B|nr:pentapeptide repeat-containing protein [Aeromicrobium fastidiosum]MCL8251145.1 pentapeptide repeat-containing protein [Aeromicrobium fastidiosum]